MQSASVSLKTFDCLKILPMRWCNAHDVKRCPFCASHQEKCCKCTRISRFRTCSFPTTGSTPDWASYETVNINISITACRLTDITPTPLCAQCLYCILRRFNFTELQLLKIDFPNVTCAILSSLYYLFYNTDSKSNEIVLRDCINYCTKSFYCVTLCKRRTRPDNSVCLSATVGSKVKTAKRISYHQTFW